MIESQKTLHDDLTAREMVELWDKGEILFTVEMGGLGPGYEQAIAIFMFDIMRELLDVELPEESKELNALFDKAADKVAKGKGYSGAQAEAATQLAYRFLKNGSKATIDSAPKDRVILVSKEWPTP